MIANEITVCGTIKTIIVHDGLVFCVLEEHLLSIIHNLLYNWYCCHLTTMQTNATKDLIRKYY